MAELQTADLGVSDKELFSSVMDDEAPDPGSQPEPEPTETRTRDDQGRFAKQEEQPEPEAKPEVKSEAKPEAKTDEALVPSWRLREVREDAERRLKDMESQLARFQRQQEEAIAQQPAPEPPDVFADPQGWQSFLAQQQSAALTNQRYEFSEMLARQHYGDERVNEAEQWAMANVGPAEKARIGNSKHPYAELIRVQEEKKTLAEIGSDPKAYREKILAEAMKDPAFQAKVVETLKSASAPGTKPATTIVLPPSINKATAAASPHDEAGGMSDSELFAFAMKK